LEGCCVIDPIPVLVSAIGGAGHGEQILKALRLAPTPYRIIGADASGRCPQFALADVALTLPRADDPGYIDAVLAVCRRFGVRAAFHGAEAELKVMAAARHRFAEGGVLLPVNPDRVIAACMDKAATARLLEALGFAPPRWRLLAEASELTQVDFFPVVIKPHIGAGGSKDCFIAQTPRDLELLAAYIGFEGCIYVQEYVGTPDQEFTVGVLTDMEGQLLNSIAVRRDLSNQLNVRVSAPNRTARTDLGPRLVISSGVSHGDIGPFPEVTEPCERIALAIGAKGPINIQCRFVDGAVKVFEINPRFSGTTSLRAMVGYNEPDVLIRRHILGETIAPRFAYRSARIIRSLIETEIPAEPAPDWAVAVAQDGTP
jgi:carbamoyl-phosphate synthase large subunit